MTKLLQDKPRPRSSCSVLPYDNNVLHRRPSKKAAGRSQQSESPCANTSNRGKNNLFEWRVDEKELTVGYPPIDPIIIMGKFYIHVSVL